MESPIVSICCITYNHAPFNRKALDGFLMQEPPTGVPKDELWYEILIHDDCSTDGTTEIIKEYAAKYPDRIFPLYEKENQYSKGHVADIDQYNYIRAKGKYIAYCEGDDYWTEPYKLRKQIDFMESHPEYSVCFHCYRNYFVATRQYDDTNAPSRLLHQSGNPIGMDITTDCFFEDWYTQPMTMVFRISKFDFNWRNRYKNYRDMHEIYHLMQVGKCRLMNFNGGVRNVHDGGIASMISNKKFCEISLPMDREFYWKTHNPSAKKQYIATLEACVKEYANARPFKAMYCTLVITFLTGHPRSMIRNFKTIFGKK